MKSPSQLENRILFLILVIIEIFHMLFLVLNQRMPIGHDGFQYFSMQYFFLNDTAMNNEIPLWIPYMNHGITAIWWFTMQGAVCLLAKALLLTGRMIASINFLDIFHYGIFTDRLLLLTGVWLLGQRYFESALTRFFVASCVMGSTVAITQFKFTFHLYYAIPLLLYFGHAFLDTGRWRFLFLACNLFMLQMVGNDADNFPIITLTIFLYFLFYAIDQPSQFSNRIKNLRWGIPSAAGICGSLLSLVLLVTIFTISKDPALVNLNAGRSLDSSVPLNTFLTYGGNMDFRKWQELLLRLSPSMDFTVYMGFLALPFVFFGLFYGRNRIKYPLSLTALILLFFSMGTWVSVFFYYIWPTMKFYRHLGLMVGVVKLLMLFLAGFGFEKLLVHRKSWQGQKKVTYSCYLAGALLVLLSISLIQMSFHGLETSHYLISFLSVQTIQTPIIFDPHTVSLRLSEASVYAMLAGFIFLLLPLIPFKKYGFTMILVILLVNTGDIYGYYLTEIIERTFVLNKDQYQITAFNKMPYALRRVISAPNPRQKILLSPLSEHSLYMATNAFLFEDALATRYRTIERLEPLDGMITAFGPNILANHAFLKIAGSTADKIQFFNQACSISDDKMLASYLNNPKYSGDNLFLSGIRTNLVPNCAVQENLSPNDRLELPYQIIQFTPNTMKLSVSVTAANPIWLMYADVWHKNWTAKVNSTNVPVFKADMAYKAILLQPGKNVVNLTFVSSKALFLEKTVAVNALAWLFILLFLIFGILKYKPEEIINSRT